MIFFDYLKYISKLIENTNQKIMVPILWLGIIAIQIGDWQFGSLITYVEHNLQTRI